MGIVTKSCEGYGVDVSGCVVVEMASGHAPYDECGMRGREKT